MPPALFTSHFGPWVCCRSRSWPPFTRTIRALSGHPPARGIPEILFATGSRARALAGRGAKALAKRLKTESWARLLLDFRRRMERGFLLGSPDLRAPSTFAPAPYYAWSTSTDLQGFGATRGGCRSGAVGRQVSRVRPQHSSRSTVTIQLAALRPRCYERSPWTHRGGRPYALKGCGVSFMEERMEWHYLPIECRAQYQQAMQEIEYTCA